MIAKKFIYIFAIIQLCIMELTAQTNTIKLWQGDIPGAKKSADYIEKTTGGNGEIVRIGKISAPELTVYLPKPEIATGSAVLIIPGGGYSIVAIDHEGFEVAKWLNTLGIAGIVLKYRLPSDVIMDNKSIGPLQDAQEAMRVIRRNAEKWNLKTDKIGVIGFSAGGHLASTLSTHYDEKVYELKDNTSARPDFSILIYPVITFDAAFTHKGSRNNLIGENPSEDQVKKFSNELQVNSQTPPAFLVHSSNDEAVPVQNSILYYQQLQKNKVQAEMHIFQKGGHGYGLAKNRGTESGWPALCANWLKEMGF